VGLGGPTNTYDNVTCFRWCASGCIGRYYESQNNCEKMRHTHESHTGHTQTKHPPHMQHVVSTSLTQHYAIKAIASHKKENKLVVVVVVVWASCCCSCYQCYYYYYCSYAAITAAAVAAALTAVAQNEANREPQNSMQIGAKDQSAPWISHATKPMETNVPLQLDHLVYKARGKSFGCIDLKGN